ncbi:hypothetical protein PsYK624_131780 [Phanerochaete sordida]|uniref:Uncharacterized protein n=1 Tax=Phanerochaete sordida TaxID=48140 RepID=A0A9P3GL73_9APHY|nr:hypothetical protein PsYK624_131780 [Phanerochaete sordida]
MTLEPKDSRSTLVDEGDKADKAPERADTPHPLTSSSTSTTPGTPFSASFDPNGPTPLTPPEGGMFSPMSIALSHQTPQLALVAPANAEAWRSNVASSLNTLAAQFAVASQALATLPTPERESPVFNTTLTIVEQAQARLRDELDGLREQVEFLRVRDKGVTEKGRERALPDVPMDAYEERLQAVEKKVGDIAEVIRLDQARLYARLLNSTITTNKMALTPLVMANGKTPQNFPATKGEFEHLTKERYEFLLKSYNVPLRGDTAAKRQLLREFIGLSPAKP